jgi:hypothetical protein
MKAVEIFVYYDDVTFIKQGWINRNNISLDGQDYRFTLELKGVSSYKKINEIEVGKNREKLYKTFVQAYSKAPYYKDMKDVLYSIFHCTERNLFEYILMVHTMIFNYLDLDTDHLISSSEIDKDCSLKSQAKVLDICKRLEATKYINAIGGQRLYSKFDFTEKGIDLFFLCPHESTPKKSIIDVLMNHSIEEVNLMLDNYELI